MDMLLLMVALLVASPSHESASATTASPDTIPAPATISVEAFRSAVDSLAQGTDSTEATASRASLYYLIFDGRSEQFSENDEPDTILRTLVQEGFPLEEAWYPIASSIERDCMAPNVHLALIVRLRVPDSRITDLGFTDTPGRVQANCGVEAFQYYDFE